MTIKIYDMAPEHLHRIQVQPSQEAGLALDEQYAAMCIQAGSCITLVEHDTSEVLMCAGAARKWDNSWMIWSVVSKLAGRRMILLRRACELMLQTLSGRLEAAVDPEFEAGHRWAKIMGFYLEVPRARRFLPDGRDASVYVRLN